MKKVVIIGGGPSGMMSAISTKLFYEHFSVTLLERNLVLGQKLKMTGGGRCNVTANLDLIDFMESYPKNPKFLYSTLTNFGSKDIIKFFTDNNCPLKEEDHGRMFPESNKSSDIINTLKLKLDQLKVKVKYNNKVNEINYRKQVVITNEGSYDYDYLIIATGGITYPATGSDGSGHQFASLLGHDITPISPTEAPLVSSDLVITNKDLQGLSFKDVLITSYNQNNKVIKQLKHDLLITHFGLSGPAALRLSYYVKQVLATNTHAKVSVDFLPNIMIDDLLKLDKVKYEELLKVNEIPKRLSDYIHKQQDLSLYKNFTFNISDIRGINTAFLTDGGINVKEINPKTFKSKIDNKVSFCGEVIDYHGFTGGFNITAALSTGYNAGKYLEE